MIDGKQETMNKPIDDDKLKFLWSSLEIFSTMLLYIFLKMSDFDKNRVMLYDEKMDEFGIKEIGKIIDVVLVSKYDDWPKENKADFTRLLNSLPREKRLRLEAEMIYFLIFIMTNHVCIYLGQDNQRIILDYLFNIFSDRNFWLPNQPEGDAYNKYVEAKNL